jgi:hypothetical protein
VVVGQHHAGRIARQRLAHHLARIDAGVRESAITSKQLLTRSSAYREIGVALSFQQ